VPQNYISVFFVILLVCPSIKVSASNFFADAQTGAQKGLLHVSAGYRFFDKHQLSVGYGTVPKLTDHDELSIYSLNYMFHGSTTFDVEFLGSVFAVKPVNFGVAAIQGDHEQLFKDLPERYPEGYYYPTANRILFEYQAEVSVSNKTDVFFKVSILDVGLANYVRNFSFYRSNYLGFGLNAITSWGVGISRRF
jgi:hypothetical protein